MQPPGLSARSREARSRLLVGSAGRPSIARALSASATVWVMSRPSCCGSVATARDVHGAGGRRELAGHEAQQGRLARAVASDEPGAAVAEGPADVVERTGAVGPVKGEVGEGDEGVGPRGGC